MSRCDPLALAKEYIKIRIFEFTKGPSGVKIEFVDILDSLVNNLLHPPVLFFLLGILAVLLKSNLEIPPQVSKFLSLYLLFDIGIKGGEELFHSGIDETVLKVMFTCIVCSFIIPFIAYRVLRWKLDIYDAGAIAATYGSISAVTFITASSFLDAHNIKFSGFMVAGMALMETPAIIAGLLIINFALAQSKKNDPAHQHEKQSMSKVFHEACFNGSVVLLVGSLVIGFISGSSGEVELKPFVSDIFKGMLSLYMLDMGLVAGSRIASLKQSGVFLISFALLYPIVASVFGISAAALLGLSHGNAVLLTVLIASASYIAVPAAMRLAVPKANMSLLLPMSLGVTFVFNILFGIPLYDLVIGRIWS